MREKVQRHRIILNRKRKAFLCVRSDAKNHVWVNDYRKEWKQDRFSFLDLRDFMFCIVPAPLPPILCRRTFKQFFLISWLISPFFSCFFSVIFFLVKNVIKGKMNAYTLLCFFISFNLQQYKIGECIHFLSWRQGEEKHSLYPKDTSSPRKKLHASMKFFCVLSLAH